MVPGAPDELPGDRPPGAVRRRRPQPTGVPEARQRRDDERRGRPRTSSTRRPQGHRRFGAGDETRIRILDAAIQTLRTEGFLGTTARGIARTGDFNQALLFYHYGSVDEVLIAAIHRMSEERLVQYREKVASASDLPSIVAIAREMLGADMEGGAITVLAQLVAGAHGRPEFGARLAEAWSPWIDVVEQAVLRIVAGTGFEALLPTRDLAFALSGMFLGIELLAQLDPEQAGVGALFTSIDTLAGLLQGVLAMLGGGLPVGPAPDAPGGPPTTGEPADPH